MPYVPLTKVGAFDADNMNAINTMFAALFGASVGGGLTDGYMIVGNVSNQAAAVLMSGDVTITRLGVTAIKASVALTTPDIGAATGVSVVLSGDCRAASFHAGATAGATAGPFTTITGIRVVAGIVTVLTGS